MKRCVFLAAALVALCLAPGRQAPPAADAAFPGVNGAIAFQADQWGALGSAIYTMAPDGSSVQRLTDSDGHAHYPAWSPDGSRIAFHCRHDTWGVCVMNADGSGYMMILQGDRTPSWSPDGSRLVLSGAALMLVNPDGTNLVNLYESAYSAAWSPVGSKIAYTKGTDLWVWDLDTSTKTQLTSTPDLLESHPDWSPDGTKIVYYGGHDPTQGVYGSGNRDIFVMNADGSGKINLTNSGNYHEWNPAFSPDGTKIAFARFDVGTVETGPSDIWIMNTDGTDQTPLTQTPDVNEQHPDWQAAPQPGTFTVNSKADKTDKNAADGMCDTGDDIMRNGEPEAECTLRAAIQQANVNSFQETVNFNIPGVAPFIIEPLTTMYILNPVVIDGTTQPEYPPPSGPSIPAPVVVLNGASVQGGDFVGLAIAWRQVTVRGLILQSFQGPAIKVTTALGGARIERNFLGTDITGYGKAENGTGVLIEDSPGNSVAENVISGNDAGVWVTGAASSGNQIEGNYIGTDMMGVPEIGNEYGVLIDGGANGNLVKANTIAGNWTGVRVTGAGATGNRIEGNVIYDPRKEANGLGIDLSSLDLEPPGIVNENDDGDTDLGANEFQNYPVLSDLTRTEMGVETRVFVDTFKDGEYTIEFFSNLNCDDSGHGEGKKPLLTHEVTVENGALDDAIVALPLSLQGIEVHRRITATATDAVGNTSEFSPCALISIDRKDLREDADAGSTSVTVSSGGPSARVPAGVEAFVPGAEIALNPWPEAEGEDVTTEENRIVSVQETQDGLVLTLESPLEFDHAAGETVIVLPAETVPGDADCQGDVDSVDSLMVLRHAAGLGDSECITAADVDCDGDQDSVDSLRILRHVAGLPPLSVPQGCPAIGGGAGAAVRPRA